MRDALAIWWETHSPRLAKLPKRRDLNAVRASFLQTFAEALVPLGMLDRFKLAGVVATWWTETLPDFKTLIENGFCGVIDGWIDAIADAVEDEDDAGPAFDPFSHKLVLHTMADYLEQISATRAEVARLKGEKKAFEQSNPPEDADDEELDAWDYAKDLQRQIKEFKAEHRDALKALVKLEKAAAKTKATDADCKAAEKSRNVLQPVFDQIAALEAELAPYEQIKTGLTAARTRYRELTNAFVDELKKRCEELNSDEKQALVLELFAQDVQAGLAAAISERCGTVVGVIENLWDKYAVPMNQLTRERDTLTGQVGNALKELGYVK